MLACLVPLPAAADPAFDAQTLQDCARIQAAALGDDYAYRELAGLTDQVGARLSGSPGAQAGVEYVAAAMRSLGAEVRLEPLRVPHWVRGPEGGALTAYPGQQFGIRAPLALTTLGMSVATPGEGIDAEVVVVADFAALHGLAPSAVRGKIVLFDYHFDERLAQAGFAGQAYGEAVRYRAFGPSEAAKLGAVAAVVRSVGGADFRLPHTGALVYADGVPRIPAAALAAEDADRITRLSAQGPVRMHLLLQPRRLPDADSFNVIADLRGSEHPEAVVIVSGHLDSWDLATGATDDGAGVAMAMQTLHTIHALGLKPRRTIRFIAWMNEENGGRGGDAYALAEHARLKDHVAAIEADTGAGHALGFNIEAREEALAFLAPIATILQHTGSGHFVRVTESPESDIEPLAKGGVPAFGLWQDIRTYFDYHHSAADTLDKVDPRNLAEGAAAIAVMAYALAESGNALPR